MPAIYEYSVIVSDEEIDPQQHANNLAYLKWMQDAAIAHSTAQGWSPERYQEQGISWVARSHTIEYRRPAFAGEELVIRTWVSDMQRVSSRRRYQCLRPADGALLAIAETNWAMVDRASGRLIRVPREVADAFELLDRPLKETDDC